MVRVLVYRDPDRTRRVVEAANRYQGDGDANAYTDGDAVWMKATVFLRMIHDGKLHPGPALTVAGKLLLDEDAARRRRSWGGGV